MGNDSERMNYSFEPMDDQPLYDQPQFDPWEQPATSRQPQKKEKKQTWKIILVLVAVAIVAAVAGALLSGVIRDISDKNAARLAEKSEAEAAPTMAEQEAEPKEEEQHYELAATPLPKKLRSNSANKSLTPKEVYAMNVGAVCGITTQVTTNIWGQTAVTACSGSGFVLTEDGYVITNNHVVEDATSVTVTLYDGTEYEAQIIGTDSMNDVALLKIEAEGLQTVGIADSDKIEVGEECIAIGNPLGELTFTMTAGYISALDREINTDGKPINMLQTDAAINSGNSGGPLFDMDGNVIGITTAKYSGSTSTGTSIEGIGFAIPINDVMRNIYDLQEYGYVKNRPYLGVTLKDLDSATAKNYNLPVGPIIQTVNEGSCAEKADIRQGDIILGYDGKEIESYTELVSALNHNRAGDTVTVKIYRAGAEMDLELTLDERPQQSEIDAIEEEANSQTQQGQSQQPQVIRPDQDGDGSDQYGYSYGNPYGFSDPFGFFNFGY